MKDMRIYRLGLKLSIVTPLIDMVLKLLIAVSVTRFVNWPVLSIFVFNFVILFTAQFVYYFSPYNDKYKQARVCFNSVSYLVLNYHLFVLTDYTDSSMFPYIANSVISLIGFNICVNVFITAAA